MNTCCFTLPHVHEKHFRRKKAHDSVVSECWSILTKLGYTWVIPVGSCSCVPEGRMWPFDLDLLNVRKSVVKIPFIVPQLGSELPYHKPWWARLPGAINPLAL